MTTSDQRRKAFEQADAIMSLEGFERTEEQARRQQLVVAGALTFDEAVRQVISDATSSEAAARADRRKAFDHSAAIMALEGFTGGAGIEDIKAKVIDGSLSFDEAVRQALERVKEGRSQ